MKAMSTEMKAADMAEENTTTTGMTYMGVVVQDKYADKSASEKPLTAITHVLEVYPFDPENEDLFDFDHPYCSNRWGEGGSNEMCIADYMMENVMILDDYSSTLEAWFVHADDPEKDAKLKEEPHLIVVSVGEHLVDMDVTSTRDYWGEWDEEHFVSLNTTGVIRYPAQKPSDTWVLSEFLPEK